MVVVVVAGSCCGEGLLWWRVVVVGGCWGEWLLW